MKNIFRVFCVFAFLSGALPLGATSYYVHPEQGDDAYPGTSMGKPFRSLARVSRLKLRAGDALYLAAERVFVGSLQLKDARGTANNPIIIGSYTSRGPTYHVRATIDAKGWLNGVKLTDCSYITVKDLIVTADAGGLVAEEPQNGDMRCGVLVTTSQAGTYAHINLSNLWIHDVFFEAAGFKRGADEVKTANGTQRYGWGIRFINKTANAVMSDVTVSDCVVQNVAHTGIKFTTPRPGIRNLQVLRNHVLESGGPGIQMSGIRRGHIRDNLVEYSGSPDDSRKWGRGSGLWTWSCDEVVIEHNRFLHANGPADSAGCHIDFNCNHVVVQYNFSAHNAGGFCEILGNNYNCAYRYNVSVNDGHRVKGKNGAFQEGKVFWLSGYQGSKKPRKGPFNSYFYNNTMYVDANQVAKMAVAKTSEGILVVNNIFCIEGTSKAVKGDQYKPEGDGVSQIKDVVFENNLYLRAENWPSDVLIQDQAMLLGDPGFVAGGGLELADYVPTNVDLIRDRGLDIVPIPNDTIGLTVGLEVTQDILGNPVVGLPDLGAIELEAPGGRR